jgi:hypothetical protein
MDPALLTPTSGFVSSVCDDDVVSMRGESSGRYHHRRLFLLQTVDVQPLPEIRKFASSILGYYD